MMHYNPGLHKIVQKLQFVIFGEQQPLRVLQCQVCKEACQHARSLSSSTGGDRSHTLPLPMTALAYSTANSGKLSLRLITRYKIGKKKKHSRQILTSSQLQLSWIPSVQSYNLCSRATLLPWFLTECELALCLQYGAMQADRNSRPLPLLVSATEA